MYGSEESVNLRLILSYRVHHSTVVTLGDFGSQATSSEGRMPILSASVGILVSYLCW